jgi:cytochrome c oxidase subunit III
MASHAVAHEHDHHHPVIEFTPAQRLRMNRVGFWMFIISETFLFSGIMVARIVLLGGQRPELDQLLGLVITSILLLSSFFVNRAEVAIAYDDRRQFIFSLGIAILMGFVFTGGVIYEWSTAHFTPEENVVGGMFFFMTGMHALHVITGILLLMSVMYNGMKGHYDSQRHFGVEAAAIYWHFVDVVWVFFYVSLYLVGTVAEH